MSPGIELGTSRTESRALTSCATRAPNAIQCNIGGGPYTTSLFDELVG